MNGHHYITEERGSSLIMSKQVDHNMEEERQSLRDDYERLNTEFMRANEERAKAAEYGLVLLEEKQQLQYKMEELTSLYETSKQELDMSTVTLRQVSRDYEKRIKDIERQRELLLSEMEEREKELSGKVTRLEEERRGLERQLKRTTSQHDCVIETNTTLNNENDRLKRDISSLSEELRQLKKQMVTMETELEQTRTELDRLHPKFERLLQYEQDLQNVTEQNTSLKTELVTLQEHYDSVLNERDNLEQQTREVYEALNEEREAKSALETKLQVDMFSDRLGTSIPSHVGVVNETVYSSAPTSPSHEILSHSTPFTAPNQTVPSLLSELQNSLLSPDTPPHLIESNQRLENKLQELETMNGTLENEREEKEKELLAVRNELEKWKTRYQEVLDNSEIDLASMRDELEAKKEIVGQLKNQVTSLSGEKRSLEIELEGLREELTRIKESFTNQNDKLGNEMSEEQKKNSELSGRIYELEEKISNVINGKERLETILVSSINEIMSTKEEILHLHRAVTSLHRENKLSSTSSLTSGSTSGYSVEDLTKSLSTSANNEGVSPNEYLLSVREGKKKLRINNENHVVFEVIQLKELLQKVRTPLEGFTKQMLERSLETSSQHMLPTAASSGNGSNHTTEEHNENDIKIITELEGNLNKMRARLANRTEEVNQLRSIMKARQTTVDVTVSSLKSKLESQSRAHETEINQFKHKLKTLRKERDDQTSLCALTSKRCQEYLGEISKLKRRVEEGKGENDRLNSEAKLLDVYLQRAIKQKLDISQQLERYREEEERNRVIPLTLSASRV